MLRSLSLLPLSALPPLLVLLPLASLLAPPLAAQVSAPPPPFAAGAPVPELFAGELADLGPQYLLLPAPRAGELELWGDAEYSGTSNVMLEETQPQASSVLSLQSGVNWRSTPHAWGAGRVTWQAGARAQTYRYGFLANANTPINFIEIDRNNFDLAGAHLSAQWQHARWLAGTALRGALLHNRHSGREFYREAALEAHLLRLWTPTPRLRLAAGADAAWRRTRTATFGLLPAGWNDRVELALVAAAEWDCGEAWRLAPALRVQGAHYTQRERERDDVVASARLALVRPLGPHTEMRLSLSHDRRESSEPLVTDYAKWDAALGAAFAFRF